MIPREVLSEILGATIRLTQMRQNECKHLCIENASAEIFGKLLDEYLLRVPTVGTNLKIDLSDLDKGLLCTRGEKG